MDISAIIDRLGEFDRARQLLTVADLAKVFGVHVTTLGLWIRKRRVVVEGFPLPVRWNDNHQSGRYWRPDELIAWVQRYMAATENLMTMTEAAEHIGVRSTDTITKMRKKGRFPEPKAKQILTGALLWARADVEQWLRERTGGYRFPVSGDPPLVSDAQPDENPAEKRRGPKRRGGMSAAAEAA